MPKKYILTSLSFLAVHVSTIYADATNYDPENPDPNVKPEISISEDQPKMNLPHTCFPGPYDWVKPVFVKNCHKKVAENPHRIASEIYFEVYNQLMEYLGLDHDNLCEADQLRKKSVIDVLKPVNLATPTIYRCKRTYVQRDVHNMEDFNIDDENNFIGTENACKWAGYGVEDDPTSRILIFATNYSLGLLRSTKAIYLDGTFRMAPKLWKQILIICVDMDDKLSLPVLFALLPDKTTVSYETVFMKIKDFFTELNLGDLTAVQAMADFEIALRNAWENCFPDTPLKNCMFHYDKVSNVI